MTERKTKPVAISKTHHEAMTEYFDRHKVALRFQAEAGIEEFLRKKDPKLYNKYFAKKKTK